MKNTERFIKDAIEGGWKPTDDRFGELPDHAQNAVILLDPAAWQAVGKVRGWGADAEDAGLARSEAECRYKMHRLIDALADGKTIESYLSEI